MAVEEAVTEVVVEAVVMEGDIMAADIMEDTMGVMEDIGVIMDIPILEVMVMATEVTSIEVAAIHAIQG